MKKGISLIILVTTVIIMGILITTVSISGVTAFNNSKKMTLATELSLIQESVNNYYSKTMGDYPTKRSILVDLSNVSAKAKEQFKGESITDNKVILEEVDYKILGITTLKNGLEKNGENDIYALSAETGKVYYAKGVKIGSMTYFTLTDDLKNMIQYTTTESNNTNKDGIIFIPSTIKWTNKDISMQIKIPKNIVVTNVLKGSTTITNNTNDNTDDYYIYNITDISSNIYITVNYTLNGKTDEAKYEVNNIDKVAPALTVDKNDQKLMLSDDEKYAYFSINHSDDQSGIKVVKFENERLANDQIATYFASNGRTLYKDVVIIEPKVKEITIYVEDTAGNFVADFVTVTDEIYAKLLEVTDNIIIGNGGSNVSELNYTIEQYADVSNLPAVSKENTIAFVTQNTITGYEFSTYNEFNSNYKSDGYIVIGLTNSPKVTINALKNEKLELNLSGKCYQKNNGIWERKIMYIFRNNIWEKINGELELYLDGEKYDSITGGYEGVATTGSISMSPNLSVYVNATYNGEDYGSIVTTKKIDLTGYNTLQFDLSISYAAGGQSSSNCTVRLGVGTSKLNNYNDLIKFKSISYSSYVDQTSSARYTVDVSDLSGEYYFKIVVRHKRGADYGGTTAKVNNIILT